MKTKRCLVRISENDTLVIQVSEHQEVFVRGQSRAMVEDGAGQIILPITFCLIAHTVHKTTTHTRGVSMKSPKDVAKTDRRKGIRIAFDRAFTALLARTPLPAGTRRTIWKAVRSEIRLS